MQIATKPGWQAERQGNFVRAVSKSMLPGEKDLVDDGWTRIDSYHGLTGSPRKGRVAHTPIGEHVQEFVVMDLPCTERTRRRVDEMVVDKATAQKLKAWYPSWCKRPTFSDEYLQACNLPNVHLVDTDGKGLEAANEKWLVFEAKKYPLDVLVLSTGFSLHHSCCWRWKSGCEDWCQGAGSKWVISGQQVPQSGCFHTTRHLHS